MSWNNKIFVFLLASSFSIQIFSWEKQEHQILADLALDSTLSFCGISSNDSLIFFPCEGGIITINKKLWNDQSFGDIAASFSGDDISQSHCQMRGCTIKQQLESLTASFVDEVWNRIKQTPVNIQSVEVSNQNTVFNYLIHHLIALRLANVAGKEIIIIMNYFAMLLFMRLQHNVILVMPFRPVICFYRFLIFLPHLII